MQAQTGGTGRSADDEVFTEAPTDILTSKTSPPRNGLEKHNTPEWASCSQRRYRQAFQQRNPGLPSWVHAPPVDTMGTLFIRATIMAKTFLLVHGAWVTT